MDVNAFIKAVNSDVYKQWDSSNHHSAPWNSDQVIDIIQSYQFQQWYSANPKGTIDQYYQYLCNLQASQQTYVPEDYGFDTGMQSYQGENQVLLQIIQENENTISGLRQSNNMQLGVIVILLIALVLLYWKYRRLLSKSK